MNKKIKIGMILVVLGMVGTIFSGTRFVGPIMIGFGLGTISNGFKEE